MLCLSAKRFSGLSSLAMAITLTGSVFAQPSQSEAPSAHVTRLILLGTAGGPPIREGRSEPSSLLVVDGKPYMIDAGSGSLRNLVAAGFQAQDIDAIFITHQHLDHNGGLADIIEYSSFGQRAAPMSVIGPLGTEAMVTAALSLLQPSRRVFGAEGLINAPDPKAIFKATDIQQEAEPGVIYRDSLVAVTAAENTHFQFIPTTSPSFGHDRSYGFRFVTPSGVVVFTGDSGPSEALTRLAKGADILVSEVTDVPSSVRFATSKIKTDPNSRARIVKHVESENLTPEEVGKMAERAGVKMVVLTHFGPGMDSETSAEPYVIGIRKYYSGPVYAGRDLDEIILSRAGLTSPAR